MTYMQISEAMTDAEIKNVFSDQSVRDALMMCGIKKCISNLTFNDKEEVMKLLCMQDVFFGSKSAIDQFLEGLDEVVIHMYACVEIISVCMCMSCIIVLQICSLVLACILRSTHIIHRNFISCSCVLCKWWESTLPHVWLYFRLEEIGSCQQLYCMISSYHIIPLRAPILVKGSWKQCHYG